MIVYSPKTEKRNMKQIYYAIQNIIRGKDSTIIKVVSL